MTTKPINFFSTLSEPYQSTLLYLNELLVNTAGLEIAWKFNTPFFYYKKKWFAFLSYNPKNHEIYISFVKGFSVSHPKLLAEGRKQQKIYWINPQEDINVKELLDIINALKKQY